MYARDACASVARRAIKFTHLIQSISWILSQCARVLRDVILLSDAINQQITLQVIARWNCSIVYEWMLVRYFHAWTTTVHTRGSIFLCILINACVGQWCNELQIYLLSFQVRRRKQKKNNSFAATITANDGRRQDGEARDKRRELI